LTLNDGSGQIVFSLDTVQFDDVKLNMLTNVFKTRCIYENSCPDSVSLPELCS